MSIFDGKGKTDREIDLEAARDFHEEGSQIRQDALQAFVDWVDAERAKGNHVAPAAVVAQARKALRGER